MNTQTFQQLFQIVTRLMTAENRNSKPVFDDNGDGTQGFKFFIFRESNYEDVSNKALYNRN